MDDDRIRGNGKRRLYEDVAHKIEHMIIKGAFRPGERIPSIRLMSRQMRVSVNTINTAYAHLEDLRLVEARPQSGYYVRLIGPALPSEPAREPDDDVSAKPVTLADSALRIIRSLADPGLIPLASGAPNMALLPVRRLNSQLAAETRKHPLESASYGSARGNKRLRSQIAKRLLAAGCVVAPDEITITSGCVEAVTLALQAVCCPGDTVAIASPVYYTFLNAIQWLGLKVLEIPSSPTDGISLEVLRYAIRQNPIRSVVAISNFSNPTGSLMPDENKRLLAELTATHEIPLIEDDVYGDLGFQAERPKSLKAFDKAGLVLHCASFSKTLAPGYRVGWIVAGRFQKRVEALKSLLNIATASPTQLAVAEFLATGGYDRHLRALRRTYSTQMAQMRFAVGRHFPPLTRVSRPDGGTVLWVEMPEQVDALALYDKALTMGIGVAPGPLFTTGSDFRNCIRLSAATWSPKIEEAVQKLGTLAREMMASA
jgi:DNA-binding transcriptional MocR family regulator